MNITEELDWIISKAHTIPADKKYWLIRTDSGLFYDSFLENGIVGLEHVEVSITFIDQLNKSFGSDRIRKHNEIREKVASYYADELSGDQEEVVVRKIGRRSSQIMKFVYDLKKSDIVIIPSYNSDLIGFGVVTESNLAELSLEERRRIDEDMILTKRVEWIKQIPRIDLDPYLYRIFTAHQAINDVSNYAQVIERSLNDFFVLDDEAHLILEVTNRDGISAKELFGLGHELIQILEDINSKFSLGIDTSEIQITVNLNSPGKIDIKSRIKKSVTMFGVVLLVFGGGYTDREGRTLKTDGIPGILKAIKEYQESSEEIKMKSKLLEQYKDSLHIKNPEDFIEVMKQFSANKDNPK